MVLDGDPREQIGGSWFTSEFPVPYGDDAPLPARKPQCRNRTFACAFGYDASEELRGMLG
jgi:hypothetical protein